MKMTEILCQDGRIQSALQQFFCYSEMRELLFLEQGKDQESAAQHKKMKMRLLVVVLLVVSLGLNDLNRRNKL